MSSHPLGPYGLAIGKSLGPTQVPFPELTDLQLFSNDETLPVIPNSFLDGSAPTSAKLLVVWHFISGIAKTAFVCYTPCRAWAL
jgi:hypothetical protein